MRLVAALIALCGLAHAQTFKSNVEQVAVPVTVSSERNTLLPDLRPNDFHVFDDGRPVPIVSFGTIQQSVHMVLLLDTSASMMQSLAEVSTAATTVVAQLAPADSVQVGTFSSSLRLSPPLFAADHQMVERLRLVAGGNMTILYDALIEGCGAFTNEMSRRGVGGASVDHPTEGVANSR